MAYCRSLTMLIWFASLALLCSFQAQAAELDETLSYIDTFDYSDTPAMGEYDYEPLVDIPETNKPTVTEPTETPGKGTFHRLCVIMYSHCVTMNLIVVQMIP